MLAALPVREAVPALIVMLKSADVACRARAAALLAQAGDADLLLPLARQLFETSYPLRRAAIEALRIFGDDRALALATGILGAGYPGLKELAQELLDLPDSERREDPAILVLAVQTLFGLQSPDGDPAALAEPRRAILLARLGGDLAGVDRQIPPRILEFLECPK
jgi:hypothetical protein